MRQAPPINDSSRCFSTFYNFQPLTMASSTTSVSIYSCQPLSIPYSHVSTLSSFSLTPRLRVGVDRLCQTVHSVVRNKDEGLGMASDYHQLLHRCLLLLTFADSQDSHQDTSLSLTRL